MTNKFPHTHQLNKGMNIRENPWNVESRLKNIAGYEKMRCSDTYNNTLINRAIEALQQLTMGNLGVT